MTERVPRLFLAALADLTQWLEAAGVPAMIVGGIAASTLGRPRATRDIDALAVAPDDQWIQLLGSSKAHGILPRIEKPLEFARRTRVLLLRHTESGIDIDMGFCRSRRTAGPAARIRRTLGPTQVAIAVDLRFAEGFEPERSWKEERLQALIDARLRPGTHERHAGRP